MRLPSHLQPFQLPATKCSGLVLETRHICSERSTQPCHALQHDYKSFAPGVTMDNVDWESAPALQETPITSAICDPANGSEIEEGTVEIPGRHYSQPSSC